MSKYIYKVFMATFVALVVTGCSLKDFENINKEKEFVYDRPQVSTSLFTAVDTIVNAMSKNDIDLINKTYIHPQFGFYNMYKNDGVKDFIFQNAIKKISHNESNEISELVYRFSKEKEKLVLKQENIVFSCSPHDDSLFGWNKEGLFLNTDSNNNLSSLMIEKNKKVLKDEEIKYKKEDLHKAKVIESMSYRVVISPEIVFHLNLLEDKWYITSFDRIITDCSMPKKKKSKKKGSK